MLRVNGTSKSAYFVFWFAKDQPQGLLWYLVYDQSAVDHAGDEQRPDNESDLLVAGAVEHGHRVARKVDGWHAAGHLAGRGE